VNKKQAIYWLSVALQIHDEPEIIEAFSIAMDELYKQAYRDEPPKQAHRDELPKISSIYC